MGKKIKPFTAFKLLGMTSLQGSQQGCFRGQEPVSQQGKSSDQFPGVGWWPV